MREDADLRTRIDSMRTPHDAGVVALAIWQEERENQAFRAQYVAALERLGLEHALVDQLEYLAHLAAWPGSLEYEEMHKVFALLDETWAMTELGVKANAMLLELATSAVRARFSSQSRVARMVAEDRVEGWKRACWWYRDLLKPSAN